MSLQERFNRDVLYLQQNMVPKEEGGEELEKLKYEGDDEKGILCDK